MNQNEPNKVGLDRNYIGYYNTINGVFSNAYFCFMSLKIGASLG